MRVQFNKLALALASAGLVTGLVGCGGGGGGDRAGLPVTPVLTQADKAFQVQFIDAITGQVIRESLNVTFSGASVADLRQPIDANRNGQYDAMPASVTTSDGVLPVLALSFTDQADSFKVSASGGGWLLSGAEVTPSSPSTVTVRLMKASSTTASYSAAAQSGSANNGVTSATTATTGTTSISVPAGATATRADGTTLAADGPLTVSVVRFNVGTSPLPLTSSMQGGSFSLGDQVGVTRFSVTDSNGAEIRNFSSPLTLKITLPAGSTFPGTGAALIGGETNYPISYYGETQKKWLAHASTGSVSKNGDGTFTVTFTSNHLSLWTLNPAFNPANSCVFSTLNLTGRPAGDATPITLAFTGANVGSTFSKTVGPFTDSSLSLLYAPTEPVNISVSSPAGVTVSPNPVNLCSPTTNTINLIGLQPTVLTALTVNVRQYCSNSPTVLEPLPTSVYFQYKLPTGLYTTLGGWTEDDGSITLESIPLNTIGELKIWNPYLNPSAGYFYPTNTTSPDPSGYKISQNPQTYNYDIPVTCQVPTGSANP